MQETNDGSNKLSGMAALSADAAKLTYLIHELDKWLEEGIIVQDTYVGLHQRYITEQEDILRQIKVNSLLGDIRSFKTLYKTTEALSAINEALSLDADNSKLTSLLAGVYEDLGQFDKAISTYTSLAARYPEDLSITNNLARVRKSLDIRRQSEEQAAALANIVELARTRNPNDSIEQCEMFVKSYPGNAGGHTLLSTLYGSVARIDDAITQLNLALALTPNDLHLKEQMASLKSNKSRALEDEKLQKHRNLMIEMHNKKLDRAQELLTDATVLFVRKSYAQALYTVKESISLDSSSPVAWALSARIYSALQMWKEAELAWIQTVRLEPNLEECRTEMQAATAARLYQERSVWSKLWGKMSQAVEAFMQERNIEWVHILGVAILLAGLIGVSAWVVTIQKLWGAVGKVFVATAPIIVSVFFYHMGHRLRTTLKATAVTLTVVASVMVPLDIVIAKFLFPIFFQWDWYHHLFAVSVTSTFVYFSVLYFLRTRTLVAFAGAGFLFANFFFMRSFMTIASSSEGVWLAIVGFIYMVTARFVRDRNCTPLDTPIDLLAHAAMAWALASGVIQGGTETLCGVLSVSNILAVSTAYIIAAYISREVRYLPVSAIVLFLFVVFALKSSGFGIESWYLYGLSFSVIGCLFLGMVPVSKTQDKEDFAGWYQWLGLGVTAISVVVALGKGLADAALTQMLPSGPELPSSLATCVIVGVFYTASSVWMKKPRLLYGSATVLTYSAMLLLKLLARQTYEFPVWIMLLSLIMLSLGYYLKRLWTEYGQATLNSAYALAAGTGVVSVSMWLHQILEGGVVLSGYRDAAWLVTLLSATAYGIVARSLRRPIFVYAALLSAAVWWAAGFSWLDSYYLNALLGREVNYGLYYLPFVGILVLMEGRFRKQEIIEFVKPVEAILLLVSWTMLILEGHYMLKSEATLQSIWTTLMLYSVLFIWQSWDKRGQTLFGTSVSAASVYVYFSTLALWGSVFYGLNGTGLNRSLIALTAILVGCVGTSIVAYLLSVAEKPYWTCALLVSSGGVLAFGCYWGFFWSVPVAAVVAICVAAIYAAAAYYSDSESTIKWSVSGFGICYLVISVASYTALPATGHLFNLVFCASLALVNACAFIWFTNRTQHIAPAYIASLSFFEAADILLFRLLVLSDIVGVHRAGYAVISILFMLAAWILSRRRDPNFALAPCVVGLVVLSIDVVVSIEMWLLTFSADNMLTAFIVTAIAAVIYGGYSIVTRYRLALWATMLTLSIAYGLGGALWVMPHFSAEYANYGIWFCPLAALLALGGHFLHKKEESGSAWVLLSTSSALVAISLAIQPEYCVLTEFITLFVYGLLYAWIAVAARSWGDGKLADILSEGSTYVSAVLLAIGWLFMFECIGILNSQIAFYRCIAALTGVIWCAVSFRISNWMYNRDWQWWARPLYWSGLVIGLLWNIWPIIWRQSMHPISLMIVALTMILYSWISIVRKNEIIVWLGLGVSIIGYADLFINAGGFQPDPYRLLLLASVSAIMAICTGYISGFFQSRGSAHMTTIMAGWTCYLLMAAGINLTGADELWYGLGFAASGCAMLCVSNILTGTKYSDLAIAPAYGSNVLTVLAVIIVSSITLGGGNQQWSLAVIAMGICTVTYALFTYWRACPEYLYAACITAAIGWGLVDWRYLFGLADPNYGLIYTPLAVFFAGISYAVRKKDGDSYSAPLWRSGITVSIGCVAFQLLYIGRAMMPVTVCTTMLSFAMLYALGSYLDRGIPERLEALTYLSCFCFLAGIASIPLASNQILMAHPVMPVIYSIAGAIWTLKVFYFKDSILADWTRPLLVSACCAEVIAVALAVSHSDPTAMSCNVVSVILAATVFAWMSHTTEILSLIHLAGGVALIGSIGLWIQVNFDFGAHRWIMLLPALVSAVGAVITAQKIKSIEYASWAACLLWIGYFGFAVSSNSSPLFPAPVHAILIMIAMGVCATLFQRLAMEFEGTTFDLLAALSGLIAYWYIAVLIHVVVPSFYIPAEHAAIVILPYAVLMTWFCWSLREADDAPLYSSYGAVALCLALAGTAINLGSDESLNMRTLTSGLYSICLAFASARFASIFLIYITNISVLLTWYLLYFALRLPNPNYALPIFGAWFAALGILIVGCGVVSWMTDKKSKSARIEFGIGAALSSISAVAALLATWSDQSLGEWTILALILAAITHSTMAIIYRKIGFVHAGFLGILMSLYLVFYGRLGLRVLDIYAFPIGVYLLALPAISNHVGQKIRGNPCYTAGLAIMLGSGLITIARAGWSSWNSYLMLVESVLAFLYGLSRHVKAFFFFGALFSAIWAAVLIRDSIIRQMHGGTLVAGVLGIIVGGGLIIFASRSEQKRSEMLDSVREAVQSLKEWE